MVSRRWIYGDSCASGSSTDGDSLVPVAAGGCLLVAAWSQAGGRRHRSGRHDREAFWQREGFSLAWREFLTPGPKSSR
jgi:hypothetical protein